MKAAKGKRARGDARSLCSIGEPGFDIYSGRTTRDLVVGGVFAKWEDKQKVFRASEGWGRRHWFVRQVNHLKLGFMNAGLKIKGDLKAAELRELTDYVGDLWRHWLLHRNAVTFWRVGSDQLVTLKLARCEYWDDMGIEILRYHPQLTEDQKKALPPDLRERWSKDSIVLRDPKWNASHPDQAEDYLVLRDGVRGDGFAFPALLSVFNALEQSDGMEACDGLLAEAGRLVIRLHQKGHEIKTGIKAGHSIHFWKKIWGDECLKLMKSAVGLKDITTNFDHKISYVTPDPKLYDGAKWDGVVARLLWWGGPWGNMVVAKGLSPFLLTLAKADAEAERERVARHVMDVMAKRGLEVTLTWSNRCFQDEQLATKMLQFLTQQGMLDSRTTLEQSDFNADEVRKRKLEDIALLEKDDRLLRPAFDAAHGPPKEGKGRPTGAKDGERR